MIKIVVLEHKVLTKVIPKEVGYKVRTRFVKYVAENGNFICAVNGEMIPQDDGNALYRKLKSKGAVCVTRKVIPASNEEITSYIESGIDKYAQYIDNYRQYQEAEERNAMLRKLSSSFKTACGR